MSDCGVEDVDLLVIGGGKAGKSLAMDRAKARWNVAMVERTRSVGLVSTSRASPRKRWLAAPELYSWPATPR